MLRSFSASYADPLGQDASAPLHKFVERAVGPAAHKVVQDAFLAGSPRGLDKARAILGDARVEKLRTALANPALFSTTLKIAGQPAEVKAARAYFEAYLRLPPPQRTPTAVYALYAKSMGIEEGCVSGKEAIALHSAPLSIPNLFLPDPFEALLSHVYPSDMRRRAVANTNLLRRLENRAHKSLDEPLVISLRNVFDDPHVGHVMLGLAICLQKRNGKVILGTYGDMLKVGHGRCTHGVFDGWNTIVINTTDSPGSAQTLAHEAMHFLLHTLYGNVGGASGDAAALDDAIAADRVRRGELVVVDLPKPQRMAYMLLVQRLEKNAGYFSPSYDPNDPKHRQTMRGEVLARIAEMLAIGICAAAIADVAPNAWKHCALRVMPQLKAAIPTLNAEGLVYQPNYFGEALKTTSARLPVEAVVV